MKEHTRNKLKRQIENIRLKINNNEGFTLIELIVVMAIIAILVLLAAPQFMGYTQKANIANIQNDTAVVEMMVSEEFVLDFRETESFDTWLAIPDDVDLVDAFNSQKLFGKGGVLVKLGSFADIVGNASDYRVVPNTMTDKTKTQLSGTFYANKDGVVIYHDEAVEAVEAVEDVEDVVQEPEVQGDIVLGDIFLLPEGELWINDNSSPLLIARITSDYDITDAVFELSYTGGINTDIMDHDIETIRLAPTNVSEVEQGEYSVTLTPVLDDSWVIVHNRPVPGGPMGMVMQPVYSSAAGEFKLNSITITDINGFSITHNQESYPGSYIWDENFIAGYKLY